MLVFAHHQEVLNELQRLALEPSGQRFVRIDGQVGGWEQGMGMVGMQLEEGRCGWELPKGWGARG